MSATLGPIHYWLYNKIMIQNNLVEEIIILAEAKIAHSDLRNKLDNQFGGIDTRPLENLIDTTNIHGWLQECVSTVEDRLAYSVTLLLKEKAVTLEELKVLFENTGKRVSSIDNNNQQNTGELLNKDSSISEIYKKLGDTLLDGMPCDHANSVINQDDKEVIWKRNVCVHEPYWVLVDGDIKNYYLLREEFIKGLLSNAEASFEKVNEVTYKIEKLIG